MAFTQFLRRSLIISLVLGSGLVLAEGVKAESVNSSPALETPGQGEQPQLGLPFTDVPADHWAYQALLNLAGTYGCLSGYPDGTFRGENAVTRYEFAAGMDACLGVLTGLIEQRQSRDQAAVDTLIEAMEQSLNELRQLDGEGAKTP
ncbi:MAG: S-layer homology domain-containing protein [Nodosilinea sp.]